MKNKAICLICNNRLQYFSQCVDYLVKCNHISQYDIVTGEEYPSDSLNNCFKKLEQYCNVKRHINKERKYATINIKDTIDRSFLDHDLSIIIEDDLLLSIDTLNFAEDILAKHKNDSNFYSVCFLRENKDMVNINKENKNKYYKTDWFAPWGWAIWKEKWEPFSNQILSKKFNVENPDFFINNWDCQTQQYINSNNMYCVHPVISRSIHIGYNGIHDFNEKENEILNINIKSMFINEELNIKNNSWEESFK